MKNAIQPLVFGHGFHAFQQTENSCGFTAPQTFASGAPASYYLQWDEKSVTFDDFGMNLSHFKQSIPDPERAEDIFSRLVRESALHHLVVFNKGRLTCKTTMQGLDLAFNDYLNVLSKLTTYKPQTVREQDIEETIASIRLFLINRYDQLTEHPKVIGSSGVSHSFLFSSNNKYIDYIKPDPRKTGGLLRKIIDVQNRQDQADFQVIIDDQNQEAFKREAGIIGTLASITPYSRITASLH